MWACFVLNCEKIQIVNKFKSQHHNLKHAARISRMYSTGVRDSVLYFQT